MASNPQFSQQKRPGQGPQVAPTIQVPRKKQFPSPVSALIIAGAMLIAVVAWLPRTPKARLGPTAAQIPAQPTPGQIQARAAVGTIKGMKARMLRV